MPLPKPPPRRRIPGLARDRRPTSTPERLRGMVREHEEEERPFDPERRGTWSGGSRHERLVVNPNQFYKDLEELIIKRWGRTFHHPEEKLAEAKRILKEGGEPRDVMSELDELLDTHGVEYIPGMKEEIAYLNAGDTYDPTIMYSYDDDKYFVSDWGTLVEEASSKAEEDAWEDWLEADVRRELETEFEARFEDDERSIDRAVTALEAIESDALKRDFWHALNDTGGEYVHESDGDIFVSGKDKAVQELAGRIIKKMSEVPEQESLGFNPQSPARHRFLAARKRERGGHEPKFSVGDRVRDTEVRSRNPRDVHNPMCDGAHCTSETGEVRVLPSGGDSNLILCRACYRHEIAYRKDRNRELGRDQAFELPAWETLRVYAQEPNARRKRFRSLEEDTPIIPIAAAGKVVDELHRMFPGEEFPGLDEALAEHSERVYQSSEKFRKQMQADDPREQLYVWMRHWATSELHKTHPRLRIPQSFAVGREH